MTAPDPAPLSPRPERITRDDYVLAGPAKLMRGYGELWAYVEHLEQRLTAAEAKITPEPERGIAAVDEVLRKPYPPAPPEPGVEAREAARKFGDKWQVGNRTRAQKSRLISFVDDLATLLTTFASQAGESRTAAYTKSSCQLLCEALFIGDPKALADARLHAAYALQMDGHLDKTKPPTPPTQIDEDRK